MSGLSRPQPINLRSMETVLGFRWRESRASDLCRAFVFCLLDASQGEDGGARGFLTGADR